MVASVGALRPEKLDGVSATLGEIPAPIEPLLADFDGARLLLFALLTDESWGGRRGESIAVFASASGKFSAFSADFGEFRRFLTEFA